MTQNKKTLIVGGILTLVLLSLTFAAASDLVISTVNLPSSVPATQGSFPFILNITNNNSSFPATGLNIVASSSSGTSISFSTLPSSIASLSTSQITGTVTYPSTQLSPITLSILVNSTINGTSVPSDPLSQSVSILPLISFTLSPVALDSTGTGTLPLKNTGNSIITVTLAQSGTDFQVNFSQTSVTIAPGATVNVIVQSTVNPSSLTFGSRSITITGTATGALPQTTTVSLTGGSFCSSGKAGVNNITISTVDVTSSGSDDTVWMPLDEVKVKVEVDTTVKLQGINLELGLFDSNGINRAGSLNFLSGGDKKIDLGTVDTTSRTRTFDFTIPADLKTGSYTLLVKAYTRSNQAANCYDTVNTGLAQSISVDQEDTVSKYIAFANAQITPDSATCGNAVTLTFDTINIGTEDQSRLKVNILNQALGIDQSQELINGLNTGETGTVTFTFNVPQGLANGNYPVQISSDYQYSNGAYHQTGSGIIQNMPFQVIGCTPTSQTSTSQPQINATLSSTSEVGQNLVIQVLVTNPGNITDFIIAPTGYESWANLVSVQPQILNVPSSQSRTATITFTPTKSGTQTFTIQAVYNGRTTSQQVSVNVAEAPSAFSGLGIGTTTLYIVAGILLVLIIIIIVLIIKASGSRKSDF